MSFSQTFTNCCTICNVASHNSNRWTFIFNASTVASLFTQDYGAKPGPQLARKIFGPPVKMCWTYFKVIGHRPVTKGEEVRTLPLQTFSPPWKNLLGIVWKIWAPLRKLFARPGVPSWLRAWAKPSDGLAFWRIIVMWHWSWDGYDELFKKKRRLNFIF